jgi:MFS family permease
MDSFIYALVLVPALSELLPRSGIVATPAHTGFYGSVLFALFLAGWGLSTLWGPVADRFGRVRTLMLTILCYSLFTFLGAVAANVWQLAIFRLLAGVGIGGEWSIGGTFVAEEWPEERRKLGAGLMHTGYYVGFFLAAIANYVVGARYGWRWMFAVGGVPALLVGWIRYGVHESVRWETRRRPAMRAAFLTLFAPLYARRTIVNSLLVLTSIVGLWAGSVYVPASVTQIALREGIPAAQAARLASYGTMILAAGTILGCVVLPSLAEALGRFRIRLLSPGRPRPVLRGPLLPRPRRRELRHVHILAPGAVQHRLPRQRLRLHHLGWPFRRSGNHVPRRRRRRALPHHRQAGGVHRRSVRHRHAAAAAGRGDAGQAVAGIGAASVRYRGHRVAKGRRGCWRKAVSTGMLRGKTGRTERHLQASPSLHSTAGGNHANPVAISDRCFVNGVVHGYSSRSENARVRADRTAASRL